MFIFSRANDLSNDQILVCLLYVMFRYVTGFQKQRTAGCNGILHHPSCPLVQAMGGHMQLANANQLPHPRLRSHEVATPVNSAIASVHSHLLRHSLYRLQHSSHATEDRSQNDNF